MDKEVLKFIRNYFFIVRTAKRKHDEMTRLASRNVSKHVLLAHGVDHTARDAVKAKFTAGSDLVSQATPFALL